MKRGLRVFRVVLWNRRESPNWFVSCEVVALNAIGAISAATRYAARTHFMATGWNVRELQDRGEAVS